MDGSAIPTGAVRVATPADNPALLALTAACPMEGDVGLCVDRAPDFFALNRLEGEQFQVGVIDGRDGTPIGCIAVAERRVYLHGHPATTMYVGDLKVHPDHRGTGAADALSAYARDLCRMSGGDEVTTLATVLAGNRAMQRRLAGRAGLPHLHPFATIRSYSISLLWRRRPPRSELMVTRAGEGDIDEMAALWQQVAPLRQFAPVHDAASLGGWIRAAPGLEMSSYLIARRPDGGVAGFLGLWDQESFKQLRVTTYSRWLAGFRLGFNAVAPALGATRLPPAGGEIRHL
ncbi:MAG: GNAT family N-acetyltransferase, partial [Acidimicrobiales bacterium]